MFAFYFARFSTFLDFGFCFDLDVLICRRVGENGIKAYPNGGLL